MSANIDTLLYVGETPWHGLGVDLTKDVPDDVYQIAAKAGIDWRANSEKMTTPKFGYIPNYHVIYREDNNDILGIVNVKYPNIVQNSDMFGLLENLSGNELNVETAASLSGGKTVFGCFKVAEEYKVLDDDVVHYFVVVNDHLKPDGNITVINTPVRVVCENTLMEALNNNVYKMSINVNSNKLAATAITENIIHNMKNSILDLQNFAEKMVNQPIDRMYVSRMLDILFPYQVIDNEVAMTRANEKVAYIRDVFLSDCMDADNLQNYKGTKYQMFNALTDFTQHYFTSSQKAYSLEGRMATVKGLVPNGFGTKVTQYLKVA